MGIDGLGKLIQPTLILGFIISFSFDGCSPNPPKLFTEMELSDTNIQFSNEIQENEKNNIYDFMNFYTGAGVGIGDINNDGLPDVFFAGNLVSNKLYLNKGSLKFTDVTAAAMIPQDKGWSTGVSVVDINNDGLLDIYLK